MRKKRHTCVIAADGETSVGPDMVFIVSGALEVSVVMLTVENWPFCTAHVGRQRALQPLLGVPTSNCAFILFSR